MVTHLIAANHYLTLFDVDSQALNRFNGQSKAKISLYRKRVQFRCEIRRLERVKIASNPAMTVEDSKFVILMLPNGRIVRDVCQSFIFPYTK